MEGGSGGGGCRDRGGRVKGISCERRLHTRTYGVRTRRPLHLSPASQPLGHVTTIVSCIGFAGRDAVEVDCSTLCVP